MINQSIFSQSVLSKTIDRVLPCGAEIAKESQIALIKIIETKTRVVSLRDVYESQAKLELLKIQLTKAQQSLPTPEGMRSVLNSTVRRNTMRLNASHLHDVLRNKPVNLKACPSIFI